MIAVLTGDVVHSSKMSSKQYSQTIEMLKQLILADKHKNVASGDIYRGDEFQLQYSKPEYALQSALIFKLSLPCTLSLAYGKYEVFNDSPSTSSGPVYIESGKGLDSATRGDLIVNLPTDTSFLQNTSPPAPFQPNGLLLLNNFLTHTLNSLTKSQSELLLAYIKNGFPDHKFLAELTGTSRQNISNRLSSMGAHLVRDYVNYINQLLA